MIIVDIWIWGIPCIYVKTPKQIMGNMGITVNLNAEISNTYDEFILEWMSDCYITLQWKYRLWSSEIIDIVKPEKINISSIIHCTKHLLPMRLQKYMRFII